MRERIETLAGPGLVLDMMTNRALRQRVLTVFDQTFQITGALEAIAVLVAVLGVIGTLTALILERAREIGVLRSVGALERQVVRMVLIESGLLGAAGALMGCLCGAALALILVRVINREFFGWTILLRFDPLVFLRAFGAVTVAAVLAGMVPARLAAGRLPAEAMRAE